MLIGNYDFCFIAEYLKYLKNVQLEVQCNMSQNY